MADIVNLNIPPVEHVVQFISDAECLPLKSNNEMMNTSFEDYDTKCHILIEFLMNCPISQALLKTREVPEKIIQQLVKTLEKRGEDRLIAHLWGDISIEITPEKIRKSLELPISHLYDSVPSKETMFEQLEAVMGYKIKISKVGEFKRNKLPAFWQVMMEILNKCISSKIGGTDQINMNVLTIMFCLITGINIDFGTVIFDLIKRSVLTKTGRIDSHLPFPRFLSILVADEFAERNAEFPSTERIWRSEVMKPWSAWGFWKSDTDIPALSESMLNLIPEESYVKAQYLKMLNSRPKDMEVFSSHSPTHHEAQESSAPSTEKAPTDSKRDDKQDPRFEHHTEASYMGETGEHHLKLKIFESSDSESDDSEKSVEGEYVVGSRVALSVEQKESDSKDPFFESDNEEENVITTGGDQPVDQGNPDEKDKSFSTTHREPLFEKVQGHEENPDLNVFQSLGGDMQGLVYTEPHTSKTAASVSSAGVRGGTSVVPPIAQTTMSTETTRKEASGKATTDEKLDLLLEEIRNQKSDVKKLSETVENIRKQTESNTAALIKLQQSSEKRDFSSDFKKIIQEIQEIKIKMVETASMKESSSGGRLLEEVQMLRANNNSMADALEKMMSQLSSHQELNQQEFQKLHEHEKMNAITLSSIQTVIKRLQLNIARHTNIEVHELRTPIHQDTPKEQGSSQQAPTPQKEPEVSQQEELHSAETQITATTTSTPTVTAIPLRSIPMGPPPEVPKAEVQKRLAFYESSSSPRVQQRVTISETSGDTVLSEQIVRQGKRKLDSEATSSKKPRKEMIEDSEGNLKEYTVLTIDQDKMMFPEEHLKEYYWNDEKDDANERPLSPISNNIVRERRIRNITMIHEPLSNPVIEIERISTQTQQGDIGSYEQNKYVLIRRNGNRTTVLDGDLADKIHPLDLIKMNELAGKLKGNNVHKRRAINSIADAARKIYKRAALADFDLCIAFEYSKKILVPPPNTYVPEDVMNLARTGVILESPELSVAFRDFQNERALFRVDEINRYSNQTLNYIKDCMNKKQEQLRKKGKDNKELRKKIEGIIEAWITARGWYKDMYKATQKIIDHKLQLKKGDVFKPHVKIG